MAVKENSHIHLDFEEERVVCYCVNSKVAEGLGYGGDSVVGLIR